MLALSGVGEKIIDFLLVLVYKNIVKIGLF